MKTLKMTIITLLILSVMFSSVNAQMMTKLVYKELDKVDTNSKTVVVDGKPYKYKFDVNNSNYRFEDDAKTSVSLNQLKVGEMYYFQLMNNDNDSKSRKYTFITFISKSKPSE